MKGLKGKKWLPYAGLPALCILLLVRGYGRLDAMRLLLRELLLTAGYIAAVGDLLEKRVSNRLVLAMLGAWVLVMAPQLFVRTDYALGLMLDGAVGFLLAGALFLLVYYVSRKGLGGGDVKFMAVSGLYLGLNGVLPTMFVGSLLAAVTALAMIALKKIGVRDSIPLVPFLYAGMVLTVFIR